MTPIERALLGATVALVVALALTVLANLTT